GSESDGVTRTIREHLGAGTLYQFPIVLHSDSLTSMDPAFGDAVERVTRSLERLPSVRRVESAWNSPRPELMGEDGRSALLLVTPTVRTFYEAELLTRTLRDAVARSALPRSLAVEVTGATAVLHDLDERSSSDLIVAERV